jgi:hypothetical protein
MQVRGFVIVDRNKGNKILWEFKTRKEAQKFMKGLVGTSDTAPTGDEAHLVIVGNAAAERQRKSRQKKKQFIHQPNRGMGRGYMTGAPHGLGEPTTGGYDTTKLDSVDAAHRSTGRNRPDGHGPDLDEQDETADVLDIDRLPAPWRDQLIEIEFQGSLVTAKPGVRDQLIEAEGERLLPAGWDQIPNEDSSAYNKDGEPVMFDDRDEPQTEIWSVEEPHEGAEPDGTERQDALRRLLRAMKPLPAKSSAPELKEKPPTPELAKGAALRITGDADGPHSLRVPAKVIELPAAPPNSQDEMSRLFVKRRKRKAFNLLK